MKFKTKKIQKVIRKPKVKLIKELNAVRATIPKGKIALVKEGKTGHFQDEYEKERTNFLGGYSL